MNAYELADRLTTPRSSGEEAMLVINHAIPMLRQQADRIAELEKQKKPLSDEEIEKIVKKSKIKVSGLEAYDICYPQNYRLDEKMFARAIEERHGIK